jgi:non-ribosomal peptide synthetase component F
MRSIAIAALAALAGPVGAQQTYARVNLDSARQLRIVTSRGRRITPRKRGNQVAFAQPHISADHKSVGWLAVHPNDGTTYPIPLELVVLSNGREHVFGDDGLATWAWAFTPDGKRVVFEQGPVHGQHRAFEQRDMRTGRRIAAFDTDSVVVKRLPRWARVLTAGAGR